MSGVGGGFRRGLWPGVRGGKLRRSRSIGVGNDRGIAQGCWPLSRILSGVLRGIGDGLWRGLRRRHGSRIGCMVSSGQLSVDKK